MQDFPFGNQMQSIYKQVKFSLKNRLPGDAGMGKKRYGSMFTRIQILQWVTNLDDVLAVCCAITSCSGLEDGGQRLAISTSITKSAR
jgi:hypothetical protein